MNQKHKRHKLIKTGLPPGSLVYTGTREAHPSEVRTISYDSTGVEIVDAFAPKIWAPGKNLWIDVRNLTEVNLIQQIGDRFEIHPLALEDVLNTRQRPKSEDYENGLFVVLPNIRFNKRTTELEYEQISLFLGHKFLISFQEDPDDTLLSIVDRIKDGKGRVNKKGSDYLLYALMDTVIDQYFIALEAIEDEMMEAENEIYAQNVDEQCKSKIFMLKHALSQFRHRVHPLRDAVARMGRTQNNLQEEGDLIFLRDVSDHIAQVLDQVESFKDHLMNLESLYHAEVSNRMNNVMKLLTIISTIFIPLSFVAGVYGMNFDNMPELHTHDGYFVVLGFMFVIFTGMMIYFKKKNWL